MNSRCNSRVVQAILDRTIQVQAQADQDAVQAQVPAVRDLVPVGQVDLDPAVRDAKCVIPIAEGVDPKIAALKIVDLRIVDLRIVDLRSEDLRSEDLRIEGLRIEGLRIEGLRIMDLKVMDLTVEDLKDVVTDPTTVRVVQEWGRVRKAEDLKCKVTKVTVTPSSCSHAWSIKPRRCCEKFVTCELKSAIGTKATDRRTCRHATCIRLVPELVRRFAVPSEAQIGSAPKEVVLSVLNTDRRVAERAKVLTLDLKAHSTARKADRLKVPRTSIVA